MIKPKQKKSDINTGRAAKHSKTRNLDSGVKHLVLLAVVEGIPETYANLKTIMEKLNLESNSFYFKLTSDLKLDMILLGMMSNSSSFPCPYCEIFHDFIGTARRRTMGRIK